MLTIVVKVCHLRDPVSIHLLSADLVSFKSAIARHFVATDPPPSSFDVRCNFNGESLEVPDNKALNIALKLTGVVFSWIRNFPLLKRYKESNKTSYSVEELRGAVEYDSYSGFNNHNLSAATKYFKQCLPQKDQHSYNLVLSNACGNRTGSINNAEDILTDMNYLCFSKSIAYREMKLADIDSKVQGLSRADWRWINTIEDLEHNERLNEIVRSFMNHVKELPSSNVADATTNSSFVSELVSSGLCLEKLNAEIDGIIDNCLLMYFHLLQSSYDPTLKQEQELRGAYSEASRRLIINVIAMATSKLHGMKCDPEHFTEHLHSDRIGNGPLDYHLRRNDIIKLVDFSELSLKDDEEEELSEEEEWERVSQIKAAIRALLDVKTAHTVLISNGLPQIVGQMIDLLAELTQSERVVGKKCSRPSLHHVKGVLTTGQHSVFLKLQAVEDGKPRLMYFGDGVLKVLPGGVEQQLDKEGQAKGYMGVKREDLKRLLVQFYFFYSPFV